MSSSSSPHPPVTERPIFGELKSGIVARADVAPIVKLGAFTKFRRIIFDVERLILRDKLTRAEILAGMNEELDALEVDGSIAAPVADIKGKIATYLSSNLSTDSTNRMMIDIINAERDVRQAPSSNQRDPNGGIAAAATLLRVMCQSPNLSQRNAQSACMAVRAILGWVESAIDGGGQSKDNLREYVTSALAGVGKSNTGREVVDIVKALTGIGALINSHVLGTEDGDLDVMNRMLIAFNDVERDVRLKSLPPPPPH